MINELPAQIVELGPVIPDGAGLTNIVTEFDFIHEFVLVSVSV